jgi:hypothetical protein
MLNDSMDSMPIRRNRNAKTRLRTKSNKHSQPPKHGGTKGPLPAL